MESPIPLLCSSPGCQDDGKRGSYPGNHNSSRHCFSFSLNGGTLPLWPCGENIIHCQIGHFREKKKCTCNWPGFGPQPLSPGPRNDVTVRRKVTIVTSDRQVTCIGSYRSQTLKPHGEAAPQDSCLHSLQT